MNFLYIEYIPLIYSGLITHKKDFSNNYSPQVNFEKKKKIILKYVTLHVAEKIRC